MKLTSLLLFVLCALCTMSCSSDNDDEESSSYDTGSLCAITGGADVITYCSAHIQASYSFPTDLDIPDNYNWAKEWSFGICYGRNKDINNASAVKCYIIQNGQSQNNVYVNGDGYAYVNDTTYYSVVLDYLEENTTYYYCTFNTIYGKTYYGQVKSFTTKSLTKAVDLGLSVKWAAYNVGARSPEEKGGYYAWGETETKEEYNYSNYNYSSTGSDICGTEYDVAHTKWGGSWRLPTKAEMEELVNSCSWQYTLCNGVVGAWIVGDNGNGIFLPRAGILFETYGMDWGEYWTSSKDKEAYSSPWMLQFMLPGFYASFSEVSLTESYAYWGRCVRPVCD